MGARAKGKLPIFTLMHVIFIRDKFLNLEIQERYHTTNCSLHSN